MIVDVQEGSPAYGSGIRENMVITQIDDTPISNVNEMLQYLSGLEKGTWVTVYAASDRKVLSYEAQVIDTDIKPSGILIQSIVDQGPASAAGLEAGMHITYIDGSPIRSYTDFRNIMNSSRPGQEMIVSAIIGDATGDAVRTDDYNVTLAEHPDIENKGFLGVVTSMDGQVATSLGITVGEFPATAYLNLFKSIPQMLTEITGWVILLGLPIIGFAGEGFPGFSGTLAQFYEPVGWAEPFGIGVFWLANALLWIGWLNFYVGLFNCLPAVPLDGGHIFRDYTNAFIYRITGDEEKAERLSILIAASFAMLILLSFLFMIFGPYIVHGL
jgi:membrane-associated protease RseP (regulator of RpoE activity)